MSLPTLTLDINKQQRFNPIKPVLVQGDKGQQLEVVILSNNQDVDLSGCTLKFEATKADNKIIDDDNQSHFIKSENKITYTLVDEAYQSAGVLTGYFRLIDSKGNKDSTPSFEIEVLAQAGSDLRSDNYVSLAQQINDAMLSYQSALKELSDKAPADWQKQQEDFERRFKEFRNQLDQNAANLLTSTDDKFKAKQREIADWFNRAQNDLQSRKTEWDTFKRQSQSDKTAQEKQFRSEFDDLKADYETKKSNLLSDYKKEFDAQKKQLSDDLATFKLQLKSQLDSTQSTINQLKNADVPAISKKLDDIRADIEKIDLDSVKKKADDAYSMAQSARDSVADKADKSDVTSLESRMDEKKMNWRDSYFKYQVEDRDTATLTAAKSYTDNKVASSKPDLSGYYDKTQVDQKDLATQNQAVELVKSQLVGDKANLTTDDKSSVVSAINWLYQKINGAFDLSSPVIPYVNDSANYTNQNMIYLNNSQSYNFDSSHTITYDSNFADSKLSNIGDGLKLWIKLRKKPYINGVQQADNNDYPISYSSSDYVSGQCSTSVQSPIIINKSDIAVSSPSESKTIVVELSGVGEMKTGSKLSPKLKITNNGNANNLVVESIQGYNFDNPNSPQVTGGYYDLDVDRVAEFELIRTPVRSLVSGTKLYDFNNNYLNTSTRNLYFRETTFKFNAGFQNVGDGIIISVSDLMAGGYIGYGVISGVFDSSENNISFYQEGNSEKIKIPKSELITNNVLKIKTNGKGITYNNFYLFEEGKKYITFKIIENGMIASADTSSMREASLFIKSITTYKNNVLFDGGYKIGKSTNDVAISKKFAELKGGLIIKINKLKLETKEYDSLDLLKRALKSSDDVSVSYEENPNSAILTIPKDKIVVGKTVQTANVGETVRDTSNNWLYSSGGVNQRLNINFKNDNTLNFSAGFYSSNDSAIFISEIQEY
ncbi:BppU family phage baseplate upper protein [Holzapfeliella sp. He02]|uniref:BppU family phage baseplate upper protein n=1 Tax=Holzapfeliella saturejae TaxID=3082953 RepID=A0ABU8SHC5_9LACO